jgi:hypothetical protein
MEHRRGVLRRRLDAEDQLMVFRIDLEGLDDRTGTGAADFGRQLRAIPLGLTLDAG